MARGYKGAFGGAKINEPDRLARVLRVLPARARRLATPADPADRSTSSRSSPSPSRSGSSTTAMSSRPCRSPTRRSSGSSRAACGSAAPTVPPRGRPVWPVWLLVAATVFAAGFRVGLNIRASNVIDVGYSGRDRRRSHLARPEPVRQLPAGEWRPELKNAAPPTANGEVRNRVQTNGRCETSNPLGDTYGPVAYLAYIPGYLIFGWSHKWDSLPAVHFTSILFDLLAMLGLGLVGRRLGGPRVGAAAAFAWAAWPFTQYISSSNTNDAIAPALLVWGFLVLTSAPARGAAVAAAGWTKFASLLVLPLWTRLPGGAPPASHRSRAARLRSRDGGRLLCPLPRALTVARSPRLLRSHGALPVRPRLAVLDLGLAPVPREGPPRSPSRATRSRGRAGHRVARPLLVASPSGRRSGSPR